MESIVSEDTGSARRSTPQKAFGIFVVILATVTAGVTIGAFVDLQGLEHAESGNLVRAEFLVKKTRTNNSMYTHYTKYRVESGVLRQHQVRVTRIDGFHGAGSPDNVTEKTCETFTINGPDDTAGWNRLTYDFSYTVAASGEVITNNTKKQIFSAGLSSTPPDWPKDAISVLTDRHALDLRSYTMDKFNTTAEEDAMLYASLNGGDHYFLTNSSSNWTVGTTTTTAPARRERRGLVGVAERAVGGAVHRGRRGAKNNREKLCTQYPSVQTAKFFYASNHFQVIDAIPRPGTETPVWSKATKAMTKALAVVSKDTDVSCFLKQYSDDAHALLMQFEALETFGIVHIVSVFVILILAAMVAHMLRSVGTMSLATMMIFIGSSIAYVCYFSWAIGHHVKRVVDAVEEAIPSVKTCGPANNIDVMYDNDAGTTETLYMIVFGMSIAVGAFSLALILSKSERSESGSKWNSFN